MAYFTPKLDNKLLKVTQKKGGWIITAGCARLVLKNVPPRYSFVVALCEVRTKYYYENGRIKEKLEFILNEQEESRGFVFRNVQYIGFNDKIYKIVGRVNSGKHVKNNFITYNRFMMTALKVS